MSGYATSTSKSRKLNYLTSGTMRRRLNSSSLKDSKKPWRNNRRPRKPCLRGDRACLKVPPVQILQVLQEKMKEVMMPVPMMTQIQMKIWTPMRASKILLTYRSLRSLKMTHA